MTSDALSLGAVLGPGANIGHGGAPSGMSLARSPGVAQNVRTQSDFASVLGIQNRVAHADAGTPEEQARRVAEEFVAKVFIEPVLKEVREGNDTPPPFGPGPGEKQFAGLMDAQRSIEMVRSASWPIVDRLAADMTRNAVNSGNEIKADFSAAGGNRPHGLTRTG